MLTRRCNYRCKHCFISNFKGDLEFKTYKIIIDSLKSFGKKSVSLSGGEIFVRDDIKEILYYAKDNGIQISCVTNGSKITNDIAKCIKETNTQIGLSLDGPEKIHNNIRNTDYAFKNAMNAIDLFKEYNIEFSIIASIMKENIDYLDWILEFCINNDVNEFRVQPIEPDGNAKDLLKENKILNEKEKTKFYKKILDLSGEYISLIRIMTLGTFKSEIVEHGCKLGLNFGSKCHSNSIPWPANIGINTDGYLLPLNCYSKNTFFHIGHVNEGILELVNKYYNSDKHKILLELLQTT